jgi:hypothetical protein
LIEDIPSDSIYCGLDHLDVTLKLWLLNIDFIKVHDKFRHITHRIARAVYWFGQSNAPTQPICCKDFHNNHRLLAAIPCCPQLSC